MTPNIEFEWVLSGLCNHGHSISKADRAVIRRQAMKKASALRRQRGNYGQINLGQHPLLVYGSSKDLDFPHPPRASRSPPKRSDTRAEESLVSISTVYNAQLAPERIASPIVMPLSGLAQLIAVTGVDLVQISSLTATHVGHAAAAFFEHHPSQLVTLLRQPKISYLRHIANRYGESSYLDDTVHALMLKIRELLNPLDQKSQKSILLHHGRALATLQLAINDPIKRLQPDVLCTIELLGLLEVLNRTGENIWAHHVAGAASLIQARGPESFTSIYEKDLLLSLVSPIICETFRTNRTCFLQEPRWQEALGDLIHPGSDIISEHSSMTVSLRKLMSRLPGLFERATSIICHGRELPVDMIQKLMAEIRFFRREMLAFHALLIDVFPKSRTALRHWADFNLASELFGTCLMALATANRLLGALGDLHAAQLEADALMYAAEVGKLEDRLLSANLWVSFYLYQKADIASSIFVTTAIWHAIPGQIIDKWRFDKWCAALQRQLCDCTNAEATKSWIPLHLVA
ncbi:hypothetical protein BX600DRAFT_62056 [Xylariales sp. PMI_506]|nr:hypothetical protein BX600DRAFT_62056 [Xylariales sp. PMI_506]